MSKKFEIFISYRRKGGYDTAKLLYDRLRMDGYSVFFDIDILEKGDFGNELEQRIYDCNDFLLVLNAGIFDRFFEPEYDPKDDWVRQEIVCALETNKNIVPLVLDGFVYPKNLPADIKNITRKNAIDLNPKHFEGAYANMKRKFLISKPHWAKRNKKLLISFISIALLGIVAYVFSLLLTISKQNEQKDLLLQAERIAVQRADSIRKAELDSIKKIELIRTDSIRQYIDSIKNVKTVVQKAQPQKPVPAPNTAIGKPPVQKSSGKSFHWSGPSDVIGQVMYEKLAPAGIKKTKCTDKGIVIKLNKANCKTNDLAKIICTYTPAITVTDCNGKILTLLNMSESFKTSQADVDAAKEELARELRSVNFNDWISAIKKF
jgi:hypothetical protein